MQDYQISGSVVVYNCFDDALKTVESILEHTQENFSLYVVDNNSQQHIGRRIQQKIDGINYIFLPENIGFGKAHNTILQHINSKYHFVINPDIIVNKDTISKMCKFMDENPDVAISCPKVLNPDNSIQYIAKRRPGLLSLISRRIHIGPLKSVENRYLAKDMDNNKSFEIDFCTGCFFVIRTEILKKINGFDPDYFLYFEDADITMKAKKYGKAYYNADATVVHFWHRETARKIKPFLIQLKSMFIYMKKWGYKLY